MPKVRCKEYSEKGYFGFVTAQYVLNKLGKTKQTLGEFTYVTYSLKNKERTCRSNNLDLVLKKLDPSRQTMLVSITANNGNTWKV